MKISVKAKAGARQAKVEKLADGSFAVSVKEAPDKGLANKAVAKALADYFHIPKTNVNLKTGRTSRNKIFEIIK